MMTIEQIEADWQARERAALALLEGLAYNGDAWEMWTDPDWREIWRLLSREAGLDDV